MCEAANLLIGVDVGTSAAKGVIADPQGRVLFEARCEYPMHRPHPGWAENDPDDWVRAVLMIVRNLVAGSGCGGERVRALAIVAQRDPLVLLDAQDRVLRRSISWIDLRDPEGTDRLYRRFGHRRLRETTGLVPVPGLPLPVIDWIRRHEPQVWARTRRILTTKDYILYRLTGQAATDISSPSRSMLYDLRRREWSDWICAKAELDRSLLPPISYAPWEMFCELEGAVARRLGLRPGTVLAAGGGDDPCAALGAGAHEPGEVAVGTGTASCWRIVASSPDPDPNGYADISPHLVPSRWVHELIITGTGTSLRWFRESFGAADGSAPPPYERLLEEAAQAAPGAAGLLFYPYLEGARSPRFVDSASGTFFGLRSGHRRPEIIRAIIEGVAFQYPPTLDLIRHCWGAQPVKLRLVDDEARSVLWNQIKADVTGVTIETLRTPYAAALGAAILAALASDVYPSAREAVVAMVAAERQFEPNQASFDRYAAIRARYERVYAHLDPAFRADGSAGGLSSAPPEVESRAPA